MRANRKTIEHISGNSDKAEVGIGTMIVFIAAVLVAAVAAAVLIDTSSRLQQKSQVTGTETTQKVGTSMKVENIIGKRNTSTSANIEDLEIFLALQPGSSAVDFNTTKIVLFNGTTFRTFNHSNSPFSGSLSVPGIGHFNVTGVRDADGSIGGTRPVMNTGDLVKVAIQCWINMPGQGLQCGYLPRDAVTLVVSPEVGSALETGFTTPAAFGSNTIIELG